MSFTHDFIMHTLLPQYTQAKKYLKSCFTLYILQCYYQHQNTGILCKLSVNIVHVMQLCFQIRLTCHLHEFHLLCNESDCINNKMISYMPKWNYVQCILVLNKLAFTCNLNIAWCTAKQYLLLSQYLLWLHTWKTKYVLVCIWGNLHSYRLLQVCN